MESYYTIKELATYFQGISEDTIRRRVNEMETVTEFENYIIRPTGRITLVNYTRFLEFLKYREKNKFRGEF